MRLSSFLQMKPNLFLYQKLGWKIGFFYIMALGKLFFLLKGEEKLKIESSVESVLGLEKSEAETKALKKAVFRGIFCHYYEKLFNAFSSVDSLTEFLETQIRADGMDVIDQGLQRGKGVLLITGHFGGVEFIPGFLARKGYPITILVRFSSGHLRRVSLEKAEKFETRIIDVDHTPSVLKAIVDNLKENRVVVTQCDEMDEWRPSRRGAHVFLGKLVNVDRTISVLQKRTGASVVFSLMQREPNQRYKLSAISLAEIRKQFILAREMAIGTIVLKFLEQYIYKHPQEWYQWGKYAKVEDIQRRYDQMGAPRAQSLLTPAYG
jgi:KDO2-lipid IV(A) lauroyltransferase